MRIINSLILFLIIFFVNLAQSADNNSQSTASTAAGSYKFSLDAKLTSHFIDRGLSMSHKDPALNTAFYFNLGPQFRLGFWGSNISEVASTNDHFWLKLIADVKVEFAANSVMKLYLQDEHFYTSSSFNGQNFGLKYNYELYQLQIEWMNNFLGTHSDANYINGGRLFDLYNSFRAGGLVGYTLQHSSTYKNYFDLKPLVNYAINGNANFEVSTTMTTQTSQFNGRGDFAYAGTFSLSY